MTLSHFLFLFSSSFVALFPVINPLGNVFIINGFLTDLSSEQRNTALKKLVLNYLLIGIGTLIIGHFLLELFNLAIPVIKLGGGLIICKTGLDLLSDAGKPVDDKSDHKIESLRWQEIQSKLFYPITFPITIGPGCMSVIFTLMAMANVKGDILKTVMDYSVIALVIVCLAIIFYIPLAKGAKVAEKLGANGNLIINKIMAFFVFCVGIQIVVTGVGEIFHIKIL